MNSENAENNSEVLITKHLARETSPTEQEEIQKLVTTDSYAEKEFSSQKQTYAFLKNLLNIKNSTEQQEGEIPAHVLQKLMKKQKAYFNQSSSPVRLSFIEEYFTPYKFAWAAILLIAVVVGATFFYSHQKASTVVAQSTPAIEIGIVKGTDIKNLTQLTERPNVRVVEFESPQALQTWIQQAPSNQSIKVWQDSNSGQYMTNGGRIEGMVEFQP